MKKLIFITVILSLTACTKQFVNPYIQVSKLGVNRLPNFIGTTYYVDSTGNNSNDGLSPATPWQTIAKVDSITFSPGDRILFKCGNSWTGQLHPKGSGTSGAPIVIDQYGTGNKPIIHGPGTTSSGGVALYNQSYWEVNNLEITNYHSGSGVLLRGIIVTNTNNSAQLNHIYINNCYVHNVNAYTEADSAHYNRTLSGGIIIYGYFNDVQVRKCYIKDCTVEGLRTTPFPSAAPLSTNVKFVGNKLENIYGDGIVLNTVDHGLADSNLVINPCTSTLGGYAGCWTYNSNNSTVSHNEVYGITGGMTDGEAFDADQQTNGDIYEYNYSHDNAGGFTLVTPTAKNNIFRYNVSVNDGNGGVKLINYEPTTNVNTFYNNVFYVGNNVTQLIKNRFNATFNNNIIYCTGTVTKFCETTVGSSSVFKNNCFYPASITATNGPRGTVSGNINTNPSFVSGGSHSAGLASALAYKLNNNSPCLNTGIPISGNGGVDYSNNPIYSGNPDMGAFQHTIANTVFGASDDAYVRDGIYANNNYGTSDSLWVKTDAASYNRKSYIKFGYAAVTPLKVQSATLNLYAFRVNSDPSRTISVYATATETWAQGSITWNNAPTDTTYVGKITVNGTGAYTLDVSKIINSQLAKPDHNISFLLMNKAAASPSNDVQFYSKEATTNQPQLLITY